MSNSPIRISPSILAADFSCLGTEIKAIDAAGADYIHIDVMDGHFVPNLSLGPAIIKSIRPFTPKPFDVHLMIAPVDSFIKDFVDAGANIITIHPESGPHFHKTLQTIKSLGCRAGVAINPATPLSVLNHVMDMVDLILIMTVNPGFGGQEFIPLFEKITTTKEIIKKSGRNIDLEVDGGVNTINAKDIIAAGANVLVAGTAVFKNGSKNYANAITALRGN